MKKRVLIIAVTAIMTVGVATAAYAKSYSKTSLRSARTMMSQRSISVNHLNRMIDLMKQNGFEAMAQAMENRDYGTMSSLMDNLTDEQYQQMIEIMNKNGYGYMAKMMESTGRQNMIYMHNSMMGR